MVAKIQKSTLLKALALRSQLPIPVGGYLLSPLQLFEHLWCREVAGSAGNSMCQMARSSTKPPPTMAVPHQWECKPVLAALHSDFLRSLVSTRGRYLPQAMAMG